MKPQNGLQRSDREMRRVGVVGPCPRLSKGVSILGNTQSFLNIVRNIIIWADCKSRPFERIFISLNIFLVIAQCCNTPACLFQQRCPINFILRYFCSTAKVVCKIIPRACYSVSIISTQTTSLSFRTCSCFPFICPRCFRGHRAQTIN